MTGPALSRADFIRGAAAATLLAPWSGTLAAQALRRAVAPDAAADWQLGPFQRAPVQPVIAPDRTATFLDPIRRREVSWMSAHAFNPASVVRDDRLVVLFRAEDQPEQTEIGFHTSRIGYASSSDGQHFTHRPAPVLYPQDDAQKEHEWDGGCEDPRICEGPDGTYYVTYTQWNHRQVRLGLASSRDLLHWHKHGSAFAGSRYEDLATKSAAIVQRIEGGRMKAARIDGRYWMVFGEGQIHVATSTDLIRWTPIEQAPGELHILMSPRPGHFDSMLAEVGPPPLLTDRGIVMLYNGKNAEDDATRDPSIGPAAYAGGQALLDPRNPARLLARSETPFLKPELPWEKSGQYKAGTTFVEGLSYFRGQLFLYYGTADTYVGLAIAPFGGG